MDTILQHPWERKRPGRSKILVYSGDPISTSKIDGRYRAVFKQLASRLVLRVRGCNLAGKRLDEEALAYWIGATELALALGQSDLAENMGKYGVLEVTPRGYAAIFDLTLG